MSLLDFAKSIWGFSQGKEKPDRWRLRQAALGWGRLQALRRDVGVRGEDSRGSGRRLLLSCGTAARTNERTNE